MTRTQIPGGFIAAPHIESACDTRGYGAVHLKLIDHPAKRMMLSVLDLDPAIEPAAAMGALAVSMSQEYYPWFYGDCLVTKRTDT
jgi:hypothetical protein